MKKIKIKNKHKIVLIVVDLFKSGEKIEPVKRIGQLMQKTICGC